MVGRQAEHVDAELREVDRAAERRARQVEEWRCKTADELVDLAIRRGYRNPHQWGAMKFSYRQHHATKIAQERVDQLRLW